MQGTGAPTDRLERIPLRQASGPGRIDLLEPAGDQRSPQPSPWLVRSLARTQARSRLETDMREIAVDLLGGSQPGELPTDCSEWLAAAIEATVTRVCDASLGALAEALDARLAAAPPGFVQRLRDAEARHDAGHF